jgi:hypothetical protein
LRISIPSDPHARDRNLGAREVGESLEGRGPRRCRRARHLLRKYGYDYRASSAELIAWLEAETPYPNPPHESLVRNPYLVVHEIVEIAEARKAGLTITRNVIVRNMEVVNEAHLIAAAVEFDIAAKDRATDHLRSRYRDLTSWCEDPLLTPGQRERYEAFRLEKERKLRSAGLT